MIRKEGFYKYTNPETGKSYTFRTYEKNGKEYFESFYGATLGEKQTKKIVENLRTSHGLISNLVKVDSQHKNNLPSSAENTSEEFGNSSRFSIASEVDAAYLSAVERGDMEAAQRMVEEAARAKGYSADHSYYSNKKATNEVTGTNMPSASSKSPIGDIQPSVENTSEEFGNSSRFSVAPEVDAAYLSAVERGDMETARRMVEEAARTSGYSADDSWRMDHRRAPNSRMVADGSAQRITEWKQLVPEDYFDHPDWYTSSPEERESFFALKKALDLYGRRKAEGNGKEKYVGLRMYRAVDKTVNRRESEFRNGDWVTPSKAYAENEGEGNPDGFRIIMHWVPLEHLYWNGDSIAELGYDDGKNYTYADTKNNRKPGKVIHFALMKRTGKSILKVFMVQRWEKNKQKKLLLT